MVTKIYYDEDELNLNEHETTTLGPHPDLDGCVALDLHDVECEDLTEAMRLACENDWWVAEARTMGAMGTEVTLVRGAGL